MTNTNTSTGIDGGKTWTFRPTTRTPEWLRLRAWVRQVVASRPVGNGGTLHAVVTTTRERGLVVSFSVDGAPLAFAHETAAMLECDGQDGYGKIEASEDDATETRPCVAIGDALACLYFGEAVAVALEVL